MANVPMKMGFVAAGGRSSVWTNKNEELNHNTATLHADCNTPCTLLATGKSMYKLPTNCVNSGSFCTCMQTMNDTTKP